MSFVSFALAVMFIIIALLFFCCIVLNYANYSWFGFRLPYVVVVTFLCLHCFSACYSELLSTSGRKKTAVHLKLLFLQRLLIKSVFTGETSLQSYDDTNGYQPGGREPILEGSRVDI